MFNGLLGADYCRKSPTSFEHLVESNPCVVVHIDVLDTRFCILFQSVLAGSGISGGN
jgi:hypothetical protein